MQYPPSPSTSKTFHDAGPIIESKHYHIPRLQRLDLDAVLQSIEDERYFVLHAPRQTGKTTTLYALRDLLNSGIHGSYRCIVVNVEGAQVAREDIERAIRVVIDTIGDEALHTLGNSYVNEQKESIFTNTMPELALTKLLSSWARIDERPIVLIFDEIDTLVGASLISVLRQLRMGYQTRDTNGFPSSVILCGVRDVRDYRIKSKDENDPVMGGSAFNVSVTSLRLRDFLKGEVFSLLEQHTEATGQTFDHDAKNYIWEQTNGQPWLVNRLARETVDYVRDRSCSITLGAVITAREKMLIARVAHLDQLSARLEEPRVRRVIEPILVGAERVDGSRAEIEYVRDLGLIAVDDPIRIANPIYTEVIPREITAEIQSNIPNRYLWYLNMDNTIDMMALMRDFQKYYRTNSESWAQLYDLQEAGPHLLLHAFMSRAINGGGRIDREYTLGRLRADVLITWPVSDTIVEKFVIECKIKRKSKEKTTEEGSQQVYKYMDRSGAQEAHLVIFDRDSQKSWQEKLYYEQHSYADHPISVWGC